MAIQQMQKVFIYALKKNRKPVLEYIQRKGVIEIDDMLPKDSVFRKKDVSVGRLELDKNVASSNEAIEILNRVVPKKSTISNLLIGRKEVSSKVYNEFKEKHNSVLKIIKRIIILNKEIIEGNAEILKLQAQVEMLMPWMGLDIPLDFTETKYTKSFIGTLPKEWTLEQIYEELACCMPVNIDIISSSKNQTCIFVLSAKEKADKVGELLRRMEFAYPSLTSHVPPSQQQKELEKLISNEQSVIKKAKEEIISYNKFREDILFLHDYDTMRSEKYEVIGQLLQSKNVFIISGYIPKKDSQILEKQLNKMFEAAVEIEQPSPEEEVPVLLQNNGFSAPLEGIVRGFSLPGRKETDPTMVMSLFYYMMFGLMLSDAGYGALMIIGCSLLLIKFNNQMESSWKRTLQMYLYCGISTAFWGIMFGSYFGNLIDVVRKTFFGIDETIPALWFYPVNEPMRMLAFSMLIGLIHLMTGLWMKFYMLLKQRDIKSIIYDVLSWFVLVVSCTMILLSMQMIKGILQIDFTLPSKVTSISAGLAVISAIVIIFTNGRESRNPFKRFLKGLYALYGITGYLSDVLSYSRLLALGLATGIIGSVINKMASMAAGGFLGPLFFIIIVIVGHVLNIAINALGAYVHTNRLQYVEFFSKFYEGGGRQFNPFGMKTKYYKVKENTNNEI
jgi:V/A-type H+-transporting ATPase subunit I